jgi:hypothetical protein
MEKAFLQNIVEQNKMTSSYSFNSISNENADFRLKKQTYKIQRWAEPIPGKGKI